MRAASRAFRAFVMAMVVIIGLLAATPPAATAQPGDNDGPGNSGAAHQCKQGSWRSLARSESPTVAFASQGDCVRHVAQGGASTALVDPRTVTILWHRIGQGGTPFCDGELHVNGFEPNTYPVLLNGQPYDLGIYSLTVTVGSDGNGMVDMYGDQGFYINFVRGQTYTFTVDGVSSAPSMAAC